MPPAESENASSPLGQTATAAPATATEAPALPHDGPSRRARDLKGRDLTQGSIPRNLWWLAWPQVVEGVFNVTDQLLDIFWAGLIGTSTIAGVGTAQTFKQLVMSGRMGLDTAMRAQVARAIGAKNFRLANHLALQGFTLSASFSLALAIVGVLLTVPLLRMLGLGQDVIDAGANYLRLQFVAAAAFSFRQMGGAALQAAGNAIIPLKATTLTRATHILLSPFLIFGWLGLPEMGIPGAALADVLAQVLGAVWNFRALFTGQSHLHLSVREYRLDPPVLLRTTKIGLPASVTGMERSIAQLVVLGIVATFGTLAVAAFSLTRRAENLAHLGAQGMGGATGVLVGQNLGAGSPDRARKTVYWAVGYVSMLAAITAALMFVFANPLMRVFTRNPDLVPLAASWLRILVISYLFLGLGQVFMQSFNTAGDTLAPMLITLMCIWGVQQPLAMMLSGESFHLGAFGLSVVVPIVAHLGQFGIAWAMSMSGLVRIALYVPYFFWGPWMKKRVI
ncbi:MAG: MATE family efflux transporter [Chloroflexi bacterium]|nr:MATE family efflux transporter [Chloroflexota bacterium]